MGNRTLSNRTLGNFCPTSQQHLCHPTSSTSFCPMSCCPTSSCPKSLLPKVLLPNVLFANVLLPNIMLPKITECFCNKIIHSWCYFFAGPSLSLKYLDQNSTSQTFEIRHQYLDQPSASNQLLKRQNLWHILHIILPYAYYHGGQEHF